MATLYGVNADKILVDNPSQKANVGDQGGRLRVIKDKFSLSADLSAADVILMGGLIPAGAMVHNVVLKYDALGAGTLDVGWQASAAGGEAADADGFIDGAAVTNAGGDQMAGTAVDGMFKEFSEAVQAAVTVATDTSATSGDIELAIYYTLS